MLSLQGDPLHPHHHHPPLQLAPYSSDLRDESLAAAAAAAAAAASSSSSSSSSVSNLKRSQALNSHEVDEGMLMALAHQMYKAGNFKQALEHSNAVYERNPQRTDNLLLLGAIHYQVV